MRRGLISRSLAELPDGALDARLERLRAAMAEARLDALLVYTNNTRAAGVSWLTGFVPYWSEALLVVPRTREPVLVVALTYRVKSWIERTSRVADVIHTPRIGLEAARMIASAQADAAVGIADLDGLSAGIVDDLREGGPRLTLSDASALFARLRAEADPTEIALATKAASIAQTALAQAQGAGLGDIIAAVEARARTLGAEEVYIAAAPDLARERRFKRIEGEASLGESFALRATVAYKGVWVRLVRMCGSAAPAGDEADARFAAAVAQLPSVRGFAGFSSWLVEGCRIAQPLEPLMGSRVTDPNPPPPRALVSVQACLEVDGRPVLLGAPALLGGRGEAAGLLVPPILWPA
jgi:Creatinase/Prolidase N-terminal domain